MSEGKKNRVPLLVAAAIVILAGGIGLGVVIANGSKSTPPASSTTTTTTSGTPPTTVAVPQYIAKYNARESVTPTSCTKTSNGYVYSGTLKNSTSGTRRFLIVVDFTTSQASVVETTIVNVDGVQSQATKSWSTTGGKGYSNLSCVIRFAQAIPSH